MIDIDKAEEKVNSAGPVRTQNPLLWGAFAVFFGCYLYKAIWAAINTPLWLDEVLSVWVIKMKSASEIWSAIYRGSEFVPPTYNLFLHYLTQIAGTSYLVLRLPSIAATFVFTYCSFRLLRRYLGIPAALFGCFIILEELRFYALQVRPYSACVALFGIALVMWDDLELPNSWWRYLTIFATLALANSIHFYSVFFIPTIGLIELMRWVRTRQFRFSVWLALFLAGVSIAVWLPLIRVFSQYNGGDVNSPAFYGRPTAMRLLYTYYDLMFVNRVIPLVIMAAAASIAFAKYCGVRTEGDEPRASRDYNFWAIVLGVSALPIVTWIFSLAVTKNFNDRYIIGTAFGDAALMTAILSATPIFRRMVPLLLVMAAGLTMMHSIAAWGTFDREPVFKYVAGDNLPIVLADAQQFFTLEESAPEYIRSRLYYLTLPPDVKLPDPTVVHQLLRWKAINQNLPVEALSTFLKSHREFYVLDTHAGTDDTPFDYMVQKGLIDLKFRFPGEVLLFRSKALPQNP